MSRPRLARRWLALGLLLPLLAHAAPRDDARRMFLAALESVERGNIPEAIDRFLQAQQLYPHAVTAFNIARSYEDMGDDRKALIWYGRFQELAPERAHEADERIALIRSRVGDVLYDGLTGPRPLNLTPTEVEALKQKVEALQQDNDALRKQLGPGAPPMVPPTVGPPTLDVAPEPPAAGLKGIFTDAEDAPTTKRAEPTPDKQAAARQSPHDYDADAYTRVVTTASRYGQDPLDAPSTVTILTADDIEASGAVDISDVLRRVPGVEVMSLGASNPSVSIRGMGAEVSNKVLWLMDGRPINWDLLAAPLPLNLPISLSEIERIEVIRGPGSAVYGANAMTGVINIVTRTPGQGAKQQLSITAGYPDVIQANALSSGRADAVSWRVSAGYDQHGRWTKEADTVDDRFVPFSDDQNLSGQKFRANARLDWRFADKGFASLSGGYTKGSSEFHRGSLLGNHGVDGQTHFLRGDLSYGPLHVRSFWNRADLTTGPWLGPASSAAPDQARNDLVDVEADGTFEFGEGHTHDTFVIGAGYTFKDFRYDALSGGYDTPWVQHHGKFFFQNQVQVKWFGFVAALRLDSHPLLALSDTLSPRGALLFRVTPSTTLRITGGTAYRAPNAVESYLGTTLATAQDGVAIAAMGSTIDPNAAALRPERLYTAELGIHDRSSAFHELDANVYWNRVTDLIALQQVQPIAGAFDEDVGAWPVGSTTWANDDSVTYDAFGGELDVQVFPVTGLDIFANVSFQRGFDRTAAGVEDNGTTSFIKANGGIAYRSPLRVDVSVSAHYLSEQTWKLTEPTADGTFELSTASIPERFLLSARLAAKPIPRSDLQLAVSVWNPLAFAQTQREHPNGQLVGPRVLGTVSLSF